MQLDHCIYAILNPSQLAYFCKRFNFSF